MDIILEGLPGIISIADDIVVLGINVEDQDRHLIGLLERTKTKGLV
jgi:hypothetical protein